VSKFEKRVAADETLQGEDEQIRNRYLHHLRQTLEGEIASCRITRTGRFPQDPEYGVEFTNLGKVNASNSDHASSIDGNDSYRIPVPREWEGSSNPFFEECHEGSHDMARSCSPKHYDSDLSASIFESIEHSRDTFAPSIASADFGDQISQRNFSGSWEYPQRDENQHAASMQNSIPEQRGGNYIMGDELVAIADLLESENRMQNATAPWKDKNSGNRFLGQQ
jgi:hypothetical protein